MTTMSYLEERLDGYGDPRPIIPGEISMTDLYNQSTRSIILAQRQAIHGEGIPAQLAARGKWLEDGLTKKAVDGYHDGLLRLETKDFKVIEAISGHPDEIRWLDPKTGEVIEIVSNMEGWKPKTHREKLEQGTGYWKLIQLGAKFYREEWTGPRKYTGERKLIPLDLPERLTSIRVVFLGLYKFDEYLHTPRDALGNQVWMFLNEKMKLIDEGLADPDFDLTLADKFDARHGDPDRTSVIEAWPALEEGIQEHKKLGHAIKQLSAIKDSLDARLVVAIDEAAKDHVDSAWGTFRRMSKDKVVRMDPALAAFLKEHDKTLDDFKRTRTIEITETDEEALEAFLSEHGATMSDFDTVEPGKPYVQLWPTKPCKQAMDALDVRAYVDHVLANGLDGILPPPPLETHEEE